MRREETDGDWCEEDNDAMESVKEQQNDIAILTRLSDSNVIVDNNNNNDKNDNSYKSVDGEKGYIYCESSSYTGNKSLFSSLSNSPSGRSTTYDPKVVATAKRKCGSGGGANSCDEALSSSSSSSQSSCSSSSPLSSSRLHVYLYMVLALLSLAYPTCHGNPDAKRLYDDLLSNYNRLIRPVSNNTETVLVRLGLRLSQLIDLTNKKAMQSRETEKTDENYEFYYYYVGNGKVQKFSEHRKLQQNSVVKAVVLVGNKMVLQSGVSAAPRAAADKALFIRGW
ncbi:Acetylcholine receptor subunit alpha-like 2 [Orchesella cincta]|uniref:Acetylcholine receptor subunit alpha-like 2 n=1 Tax=Orchesella cincta TaxID=48709 RepID=A0A1D2MXN7_ORCCI|nr:Acetylcholine receptor subunit alpha-like 2 [Orchesella cincta]